MTATSGRVFVVHNPLVIDEATGRPRLKHDVQAATRHGVLVDLVSPRVRMLGTNTQAILEEMGATLADYREGDALLLIGNPNLIGWAVAIAARRNRGRVSTLVWRDRTYQRHDVVLPGY